MPGFNTTGTFKIFIGKIPEKTVAQDIKPLFENYGKVLECDILKNYGFVHMEDPAAGYEAIKNLNGTVINGSIITVEEAKNKKRTPMPTTKIFVGNISESVKASDIRALFSRYGTVAECDLVKNYGFVHIDTTDLTRLLKELNGHEIGGQCLKVQISTSHVRQRPGMGNPQQCYKCGRSGHWSKECIKSPTSVMTGQPQYLPDPMQMMPPRTAYTREMYPHPNSSNRLLGAYSVPDPRNFQMMPEYYDPYCQSGTDYSQTTMAIPRRDVIPSPYPPPSNRISSGPEYDIYGRRSPNVSNIANYSADGRAYENYSVAAVPYTYQGDESWTGYGDYSTSAVSSIPLGAVDPYAPIASIDGRTVSAYEGYNSIPISISDDRRIDRRDGSSRSSSRYAPY